MRRSAFVFLLFLFLGFAARSAGAQAVESADTGTFSVSVGGMASGFDPGQGHNVLIGAGTYVDVHFTHWVQLEGEARWLRWNQYYGLHEDHYLIGPRVPVMRIGGKTQVYGKAMFGLGKETFPFGYGYGSFSALAFGGSMDYRMSRRVTLRAIDFEWQYWPKWLNNKSLYPYGISAGVAYRVF